MSKARSAPESRGTFQADSTRWSKGLAVEVGGRDVVCHIGTAGLRLLADRVGLTGRLSEALPGADTEHSHDRGRVFTDIAVAIADGGTRITDIDTVGAQEELFGVVASVPTAWRALQAAGEEERLGAVAAARAAVRAHVGEQIVARHGRIPPCTVAGRDLGDMIVIRLDASIVIAHSDTELMEGTTI